MFDHSPHYSNRQGLRSTRFAAIWNDSGEPTAPANQDRRLALQPAEWNVIRAERAASSTPHRRYAVQRLRPPGERESRSRNGSLHPAEPGSTRSRS